MQKNTFLFLSVSLKSPNEIFFTFPQKTVADLRNEERMWLANLSDSSLEQRAEMLVLVGWRTFCTELFTVSESHSLPNCLWVNQRLQPSRFSQSPNQKMMWEIHLALANWLPSLTGSQEACKSAHQLIHSGFSGCCSGTRLVLGMSGCRIFSLIFLSLLIFRVDRHMSRI